MAEFERSPANYSKAQHDARIFSESLLAETMKANRLTDPKRVKEQMILDTARIKYDIKSERILEMIIFPTLKENYPLDQGGTRDGLVQNVKLKNIKAKGVPTATLPKDIKIT